MQRQTTISKTVKASGVGLHRGKQINLILEPMSENSGIVFFRSDKNIKIKVSPENIVDTKMATVIGKDGVTISTIEHLLSAVYAYGIDNLKISVDADEIPAMDGSSAAFCVLLDEAGIEEQNLYKKQLIIKKPIRIQDGEKFVEISPQKSKQFEFSIKFSHPSIAEQNYDFDFNKQNYIKEIAPARTFGFLKDIETLQSMGLALGGSLDNAIVLDDEKILNTEGLRYPNEFVRHKILDAIGDMAIVGYEIIGKYSSHAGSHYLNYLLTTKVLQDSSNYEIEEVSEELEYSRVENV